MSSSSAQYFYGLPKFETMPHNAQNVRFDEFNDESPLKRLRNNVNPINNNNDQIVNTLGKPPMPSSYIPSVYFENSVPHPYLIFYNLHLRDLDTENGYYDEEPSESIIAQLNKYFKVQDILSFASSKNDYLKISETWNKRFPDAKSSLFFPIREDTKIIDLQDIQSLHLLGFQLNATFFLLFKIGEDDKDENTRYYNMKLGPDSSDFDIHFLVLDHVDKSEVIYDKRDGGTLSLYKHDLWLSLQLIEIGIEDKSDLTGGYLDNEDRGVTFLEIEKRNPIPFIQIPSLSQFQFTKVTWSYKNAPEDKSDVLFSEDFNNRNLQITVLGSPKYISKMNKIKTIVTKINKKKKEANLDSNRIRCSFDDNKCFFAYINKSAFLVTEQEMRSEDIINTLNKYFATESNKPNDAVIRFVAYNQKPITEAIRSCIISYRERLKCPLTYGDIVRSNHPLISELCTYNIIHMMLASSDYMDEDLNRNHAKDGKNYVRVVPIEDDSIFFKYKDYLQCEPTDKKSEITDQWKKLSDTYPQIMPCSVPIYNSSECKDLVARFRADDSPMFSCFYIYLKKYNPSFVNDNASTFQIISKKTINHLLESKIGLNPIVTPIIHREFLQLCKTCCIHYFSNRKYNNPVNDILMRDIQTISEFKSRTSVKIIKNEGSVEENAKMGAFPIKKQTFIKMLEMKSYKQIPDPSFDFVKDKQLLQAISNSDVAEPDFHVPKYKYQFYTINNNKIIDFVSFTIKSFYQLKFIYVSRGTVFSVGESGDTEFVYGTCEALDTEMKFDNLIKGKFIDAVYLEENSCLIICYYFNKKYCFTGYDYQGIINECQFEAKRITVKSLVVISRTYFASFDGKSVGDNFEGFSVFNYNPKERRVEFHEYSEKWRITESSYGGGDLFRQYLLNEANKKERNYMPSFIGSQFTYGSNTSTFCIYKYDSNNNCLINQNSPGNQIHPKLNFSFESNSGSNDDQNEENELLEKRILKGSNDTIKSMLNLLPLRNNNNNFSTFDIHCSLCELFPTPVVINNKIITRTSDNNLSFYSCDYKIYRVLTDQIYGFYVNTFSRISLFAAEDMLNMYGFDNIHVALIVDTCGIGAKFSNMFFGTKFNEKDILSEDIWSGFSYSGSLATIVLLFRVTDTESIYNAVKPHIIFNDNNEESEYENHVKRLEAVKKDINPTIFFCKKDGVKYSIRLGFSPEIILNGIGSKSGAQNHEITFIGNNEFMSQTAHLRNEFYDFTATDDTRLLPNIINDSSKALKIAKMIITRYLSFHTFDHYPLETIEKYSLDVKPFIYNIGDHLNIDDDDDEDNNNY